ncbi:TetR/AcrR family transcriptional regulator [Histidinibacterium lentulum]|uniref:TetR/AcrR family transcriptional regulator n=1 Tax=Histidinibacterium lentulum TaxID=2480588 RepID=UPI001607A5D3|nr:TetR/AcrR family transcriptional regulator [Histidinibacterium lentulum]
MTAARLFQERGLNRVGINEIIREADVARMSLYNNFKSKEDLALAAYGAVSKSRQDAVDAAIAASDGPEAAILAIFDLAADLAGGASFRGCAFIDLAAHAAVDDARLIDLVRRHKSALRGRFSRLAERAGVADPEKTARQLLALWDGSLTDAFIEGDAAPVSAARCAAEHLLSQGK